MDVRIAAIGLGGVEVGNPPQKFERLFKRVHALGLKAVFLVTSVLGLTGLWIAIMADTGATVLVTLNSLRLLRFNPERGS